MDTKQTRVTRWARRALLAASTLLVLATILAFGGHTAPVAYAQTDQLGTQWQTFENRSTGVWTRRGSSNVFDAVWTGPGFVTTSGMLTLSVAANQVVAQRVDTSDGVTCNYVGTVTGNGSASGTYTCSSFAGVTGWVATILGAQPTGENPTTTMNPPTTGNPTTSENPSTTGNPTTPENPTTTGTPPSPGTVPGSVTTTNSGTETNTGSGTNTGTSP